MITIRKYEDADNTIWDELTFGSINGTFLHSRKYISYHKDKFIDVSLVVEDENNNIVGVFPAAEDNNKKTIVSHPGITYGGVVHKGYLRGELMIKALGKICEYYKLRNYSNLLYKAVPILYHRTICQDDLYAIFRLGAFKYRCDISAVIDLDNRIEMSQLRKRCLKKAVKSGMEIVWGFKYFDQYWSVLEENLISKHQVRPVHTIEELLILQDRFPNNIECVCAILNNEVIAGIILFKLNNAVHAQYSASNSIGNNLSALDLVFNQCIDYYSAEGMRYFDFGNSNEEEGKVLNKGLYRFKTGFGAGSVVHEFYEFKL